MAIRSDQLQKLPAGNAQISHASFKVLTVDQFFSAIPWNDRTLKQHEADCQGTVALKGVLPLISTVNDFFAAVNWEGMAIASRPTISTVQPTPAKTNQFTLDQFSDLF
ncbi:MAG: hypothetical protein HC881_05305 [Leptolyngbyaceae cyanobacterium SL_7_1]|nr:hypothetical protein [Leptolyngbyaceae cyanobacterium SL_7_1]